MTKFRWLVALQGETAPCKTLYTISGVTILRNWLMSLNLIPLSKWSTRIIQSNTIKYVETSVSTTNCMCNVALFLFEIFGCGYLDIDRLHLQISIDHFTIMGNTWYNLWVQINFTYLSEPTKYLNRGKF